MLGLQWKARSLPRDFHLRYLAAIGEHNQPTISLAMLATTSVAVITAAQLGRGRPQPEDDTMCPQIRAATDLTARRG